MIRRGSEKIGSIAVVTENDLKCHLTKEILIFRIMRPDLMTFEKLFYTLNNSKTKKYI